MDILYPYVIAITWLKLACVVGSLVKRVEPQNLVDSEIVAGHSDLEKSNSFGRFIANRE